MVRLMVVLALMLGCTAHAQQRRDGDWFAKLGDAQLAFVAGFLQGAETGAMAGTWSSCPMDANVAPCFAERNAKVREGYLKYVQYVDPPQMHKGVLAFYADYRNTRIEIPYAILHTGKAIAGVPAAELEKGVEMARQLAAR